MIQKIACMIVLILTMNESKITKHIKFYPGSRRIQAYLVVQQVVALLQNWYWSLVNYNSL